MKRLIWLGVLPLVVLGGFVVSRAQNVSLPPTAAQTNAAPASIHALHAPGLENFFQLTDNIYSGSAPEGEAGFQSLKDRGIKTIITVDGAKPDVELAKKFGLRYVHLPIGYDGVPDGQGLRMVKAVESLPGPVYIHCHHGLHRGPAGAAVVCMATAGWTSDQAVAWLRLAGTATNYPGLYRTVDAFRPPSPDTLKTVSGEFPETSPVSPLADLMLQIDATLDRVNLIKAAGYQTPPSHPDLDPENEALQLHELLKELLRSPIMEQRTPEFRDKLTTAEEAANSFHLSFLIKPFNINRADTMLRRTTDGCADCHRVYRN